MKHLRYFLMAALVAMPLTACDEDSDPIAIEYGTVMGTVMAEEAGLSGVEVGHDVHQRRRLVRSALQR